MKVEAFTHHVDKRPSVLTVGALRRATVGATHMHAGSFGVKDTHPRLFVAGVFNSLRFWSRSSRADAVFTCMPHVGT